MLSGCVRSAIFSTHLIRCLLVVRLDSHTDDLTIASPSNDVLGNAEISLTGGYRRDANASAALKNRMILTALLLRKPGGSEVFFWGQRFWELRLQLGNFSWRKMQEGQLNPESRTLVLRTFNRDSRLMSGADGLDNGQAESRSTRFARARLVGAIETIEDERQRCGGDSDACVCDGQDSMFLVSQKANKDASPLRRVLDCIVDEVHDHLFQAHRIPG